LGKSVYLQELQTERDLLKKTMKQQAELLQQNLADMKRQLEEKSKKSSELVLDQVKLPKRISEWRAAHVQAWMAYQMDLPQYVPAFEEASVDGLLLLSYITDESLSDDLGITTPLHRKKILTSISALRDREASLKDLESKHQASRAQSVEEPRTKKSAAPADVVKKQKQKQIANVREQNEVERVRLARDMKAYREAQARAAKKRESKSNIWKFEYTGAEEPRDTDIWADSKANGRTAAYDLTMAELFNQTGVSDGYIGSVRQVPANLSFDEVLSVIKGAMYDVSNRLIRIEQAKQLQSEALDSDLESAGHEYDVQGDIDETESHIDDDPPNYDETALAVSVDDRKAEYNDTLDIPQNDEVSSDPPPYSTSVVKKVSGKQQAQPPVRYDRVGLIFSTMVNLQNNGASWIGQNDKLTRLKLYGALESVLRLKLGWPQFDALWTHLDSFRTGEIDKSEFKAYFGDLSSFETNEGIGTLSTHDGTSDMRAFAKILYEFCDILRGIGFTVSEIFSTFDRNGSGLISLSEFCSLVRTVLGKNVDKKQIYRAFALFDIDNSRSVELNEIMLIIYKIWKSQLQELAEKISALDERTEGTEVDRLIKERGRIKDAIRKNYPREWRDRTERLGDSKLSGPFSSLLNSLQIGTKKFTLSPTLRSTTNFSPPGSPNGRGIDERAESSLLLQSRPRSPIFGRNEMRRYKLNASSDIALPKRPGRILTMPKTVLVNANSMFSAEEATAILRRAQP
jgi:Ca2+-binding EF-hand superfamily protein